MLYLTDNDVPPSPERLAYALRQALGRHARLPPGRPIIRLQAPDYPQIEQFHVDLTDAELDLAHPPPRPQPAGQPHGTLTARTLSLLAHPVRYGRCALHLDLEAREVQLVFDRDAHQRQVLLLHSARHGSIDLRIGEQDLQALLLSTAQTAAEAHGLKIRHTQLSLQPLGPRSLQMDVHLTASKFILSGTIRLSAQLQIDDQLNARFEHLHCHGEGKVGALVSPFVQAHLAKLRGRTLPLLVLPVGNLKMHDLRIDPGPPLHIQARFGSDVV